jgi:hypothetical protein
MVMVLADHEGERSEAPVCDEVTRRPVPGVEPAVEADLNGHVAVRYDGKRPVRLGQTYRQRLLAQRGDTRTNGSLDQVHVCICGSADDNSVDPRQKIINARDRLTVTGCCDRFCLCCECVGHEDICDAIVAAKIVRVNRTDTPGAYQSYLHRTPPSRTRNKLLERSNT